MLDNDVLGPDRRETVAAMFADAFGKTWDKRRKFQVWPVFIGKTFECADPQKTGGLPKVSPRLGVGEAPALGRAGSDRNALASRSES